MLIYNAEILAEFCPWFLTSEEKRVQAIKASKLSVRMLFRSFLKIYKSQRDLWNFKCRFHRRKNIQITLTIINNEGTNTASSSSLCSFFCPVLHWRDDLLQLARLQLCGDFQDQWPSDCPLDERYFIRCPLFFDTGLPNNARKSKGHSPGVDNHQ